jgi:hypothetical protein
MLLPIYPQGNSPRYQFYGRLGGLQIRSGLYGGEKNLFPLPGIEPRLLDIPVHSLVAMQTELISTVFYANLLYTLFSLCATFLFPRWQNSSASIFHRNFSIDWLSHSRCPDEAFPVSREYLPQPSHSSFPENGNSRFLRNIGNKAHTVYTEVEFPCVLSSNVMNIFPKNIMLLYLMLSFISFYSHLSNSQQKTFLYACVPIYIVSDFILF